MALLNPSPVFALPEAMWLVFQTVSARAPIGEDELFALISPYAIRGAAAVPGVRPPTEAARVALRELREYGLVSDDAAGVTIAPAAGRPTTYGGFCATLRTAVLATATATAPLDEARANDLLRGLAWLLTEDPVGEPWTEPRAAEARVPAEARPAFVNATRFNAFRFWAPALGFAEYPVVGASDGAALLPNPTRALRDFVTATYAPGTDVRARQLLDDFRAAVPVVPGGATSRALGYDRDPRDADRATTYALLSGDARGWLKLHRRADAADTVLLAELDGSGQRPISNVVIAVVADV